MAGTIYHRAAIRLSAGGNWFYLPPFEANHTLTPIHRSRTADIPFGTFEILEDGQAGWNIGLSALYAFPHAEAGAQFERSFLNVLYASGGAGRDLDVCLSEHTGSTLTEICRLCRVASGSPLSFDKGFSKKWRPFKLGLVSRDNMLYSTGSGGFAAPGPGPFDIFAGAGQTVGGTGGTSNSSPMNTNDTTVHVTSTAAFTVGDMYVQGTEVFRVESINAGADTISVTRGAMQSIPYPHPAGDPIYQFVSQPTGGIYVLSSSIQLSWPDEAQTTDADNAPETQRTPTMGPGVQRVSGIQIVAGNAGMGAPGSYTKIRISKSAWNGAGAYIEATIAQGSSTGAVATGNMVFNDGDTLYAWIADGSGQHAKIQLFIRTEM